MTTNTSQPSWTQAFRQYLRAIPKGDFHPAEPSKINRLEILCKHPLPQSYREFLELMGARPQRILGEFQGDISIDEAIEIYATEDNKPPENHLIIGSGILNVLRTLPWIVLQETTQRFGTARITSSSTRSLPLSPASFFNRPFSSGNWPLNPKP